MKKLIFFLILLTPKICSAAQIPDAMAVKCLVGEAGNQGFEGMQAVGEVIRHRGATKGLYGCENKVFRHSKQSLKQSALRAWKASETSNLTQGATHFENVESFGFPSWAKKMKQTIKIKNHTFFRETLKNL